ncbi:MAG: hypothetical protein R2744_07265 [Bacteroidales bacterium]
MERAQLRHKSCGASALDLMTRPELLKKAQDEFREYSSEHPYKSLLPENAAPPLDPLTAT